MANSQNGWLVLDNDTTGQPPRLRHWDVPAADRDILLRDGSAGFLLIHLAMWFDAKIERIDTGQFDDWGYASRPIRGSSTTYSNHASGTAMDLNATRHPLGIPASKNFSKEQIVAIHKRLPFYKGCIRWGGDYKNRPDPMHWELDKGMKDVEKRARELCDSKRGKKILEANPGARALIFA
jgi:hypothetical protein